MKVLRKFEKNRKKLVIYGICVLLFCNLLTFNAKAVCEKIYDKNDMSCKDYKEYLSDDCKIVFQIADSWENGHNVKVSIYNIGDAKLLDWRCSFDYQSAISNIWDANLVRKSDDMISIEAPIWKKSIDSNEEYSFGFTCEGSFSSFPQNCVVEKGTFKPCDNFKMDFDVDNAWSSGCTGNLIIHNLTDSDIHDWRLEFDSELCIDSVWNAILVSEEKQHYVLGGCEYSSCILAGESISVGFLAASPYLEEESFKNFQFMSLSFNSDIEKMDQQENYEEINEEMQEDNEISGESIKVIRDEELGEMYYKPATTSEVCVDTETGIRYIKNQLLISAIPNSSKEEISNIIEECNAKIVGYIELSNDYQIEFEEDKSYGELQDYIDMLQDVDLISYASVNTSGVMEENAAWTEYDCDDELYNDGIMARIAGKDADETAYHDLAPLEVTDDIKWGDNWALKNLNVPAAWKLVENKTQVNVGIYDMGFGKEKHEDVSNLECYNNDSKWIPHDKRSHGTAVAGIIGADHNDIGIAGVSTNAKIYAWTFDYVPSAMSDKVAIATLVGKHVRVINYSMGYTAEITYSIQMGLKTANDMIKYDSEIMTEYIKKLYDLGYDFLIVTAAGNSNGSTYSLKNSSNHQEYKKDIRGKRECEIEAVNNSEFNAISYSYLKDRIIVVSAVEKIRTYIQGSRVYDAACMGERVDVYAPGKEILSTVPDDVSKTEIKGYQLMNGTSFAAPHITGIAALMYQANPSLRADQVKKIICSDENKIDSFTDKLGVTRNMPDAEKCVKAALELKDGHEPIAIKKNGILTGMIKCFDDISLEGIEICLSSDEIITPFVDNRYKFYTTSDGSFACSLPEAVYKLTITKTGYEPISVENIEIISEETCSLELYLRNSNPKLHFKGIIEHNVGESVSGAEVKIRTGYKFQESEYLKDEDGNILQACTDENGAFDFELQEGQYTIEVSKEGYEEQSYSFYVKESYAEQNQVKEKFFLQFKHEETIKVVLEWGYCPIDFDLNLSCISGAQTVCRVSSKRNTNYLPSLKTVLSKDAKSSYGTETLLISGYDSILRGDDTILAISIYDPECPYGVRKGSHHPAEARLLVYKNGELINVFEAPSEADRKVWYAFDIKEGGKIEYVNVATDLVP